MRSAPARLIAPRVSRTARASSIPYSIAAYYIIAPSPLY